MTLTARRRAAAVAALVLASALVAAVVVLQRDQPVTRDGIDIPAGRERAVAACAAADEVFRIVEEDGPAPDVMAAADAAKRESARARDHDPMWSTLASGADALVEGLRRDDARAAGLGRRILDLQCGQLRAPAPRESPA